MKKKISLLLLFIMIFFINATTLLFASSSEETYKINQENIHPNFTKFSKNLYKEGAIKDSYLELAKQKLSTISETIKEDMFLDGWAIVITDKNLSKTYFNGEYKSIAGATLFKEKVIYLEDRNSAIDSALTHEIGHYLDWKYKFISWSKEFWDLYEEEKNSFVYTKGTGDNHEISNSTEFFASVFDELCINLENAEVHVPKSSAFVLSLLTENERPTN